MCLISVASSSRVPESSIRQGFLNHPDGTSVSYHLEDGSIKYKKNITVEEAIEFSKTLPLGYAFHHRYASVGGKDPKLTHPFPISSDVRLENEGVDKAVLIHNGHFSDWNSVLVNHLSTRLVLPKGPWSDSRCIAFLVSIHGPEILDLLGFKAGKFVIMTQLENFFYGYFEEVDGVKYSNDSYKSARVVKGTGLANSPSTSTTTMPSRSTVGTPHNPGRYAEPSKPLNSPDLNTSTRETMTDEEYKEVIEYFQSLVPEEQVLQAS